MLGGIQVVRSDDLIIHVLRYLEPKDLVSWIQVHRECSKICHLNQLWAPYLLRKWNLSEDIVIDSSQTTYTLYRRAHALPFDFEGSQLLVLRRDPAHDNCINAIYPSIVGVGERVLKSTTPFPSPRLARNPFSKTFQGLFEYIAKQTCPPSLAFDESWKPPACWRDGRASFFAAPLRQRIPLYYRDSLGSLRMSEYPFVYFEVEILPAVTNHDIHQTVTADCIAIGLSGKSFPMHGFMPGWTRDSYGYHSDDGGLFHARGHMLRSYGPHFGVGDVVGCGVFYPESSCLPPEIFFTVNGNYLGCAFVDPQGPLYPTVGIDSNVSVVVNTGLKPFRMDLSVLHERLEHPFKHQMSDVKIQSMLPRFRQPSDAWTALVRALDEADSSITPSSILVQFQEQFSA